MFDGLPRRRGQAISEGREEEAGLAAPPNPGDRFHRPVPFPSDQSFKALVPLDLHVLGILLQIAVNFQFAIVCDDKMVSFGAALPPERMLRAISSN
jgi:hypothetical protein